MISVEARRPVARCPRVRGALQRVENEKAGNELPVQRKDIELNGQFVERYFKPMIEPVSGNDGEVRYIIHGVEDVTAAVKAG